MKGITMFKRVLALFAFITAFLTSSVFADVIAAPDTTEIMTSLSNVFGAVLGVAVVIYGYNKIKSLLR